MEEHDLNTQEARESFVSQLIEQRRNADEADEINQSVETEDDQQEEEDKRSMPQELSTPVSLSKADNSEKKKKKKKKKKSKTAHLPEAGSALPDDYLEANNEDAIENPYDPANSLAQRVEYALWKYRKNHKFSDARKKIFENYLTFGGIKTGPNMFLGRATGADSTVGADDDNVDWEAAKMATEIVPDAQDEEGLEVNFTEVAQVYLGNNFIHESLFLGMSDYIDAPNLIDAFLRYLQLRNVAPEYADDIAGAREICAAAKIELPLCKQISLKLPSAYNKACAAVFGTDTIISNLDVSWMNSRGMNILSEFIDPNNSDSALEEKKELVRKHIPDFDKVSVVDSRYNVFAKIKEIAPYDKENAPPDELIQVVWENQEDTQEIHKVFFEKEFVDYMLVGMFFNVDITNLSNGECYVDVVHKIYPTFYMEDDCIDESERFIN